jgi:hypothetical protein
MIPRVSTPPNIFCPDDSCSARLLDSSAFKWDNGERALKVSEHN